MSNDNTLYKKSSLSLTLSDQEAVLKTLSANVSLHFKTKYLIFIVFGSFIEERFYKVAAVATICAKVKALNEEKKVEMEHCSLDRVYK